MNRAGLAFSLLLVLLVGAALAPASGASAGASPAVGGHYAPQVGDKFVFSEYILLDNGAGNYSGYAEYSNFTGSEQITSTLPNGTEGVYYQNTGTETDNQGDVAPAWANGNFTFSANTYQYVQGTDDQVGYSNPSVWFYMNNSLSVGATFEALNTPMTVESTNYAFPLPGSLGGYVSTIFAEGQGTYSNTPYGDFTATYTWMMYFDPATGYIVGYTYAEQDVDPSGNAFSYIDSLWVTSTSYGLTAASAPATDLVSFSLGCGSCAAIFGGGNYTNGQSVSVLPDATYLLAWYPGSSQTFNSWSATGGTLGSTTASVTTIQLGTSAVSITSSSTPVATPFPWGTVIALLVVLIVIILIIWLIVRSRHRHPRASGMNRHSQGGNVPYAQTTPMYGAPAPLNMTPGDQPAVQQIVIKETVKVPCAYCGTLIDSTATVCPKCGAPRS